MFSKLMPDQSRKLCLADPKGLSMPDSSEGSAHPRADPYAIRVLSDNVRHVAPSADVSAAHDAWAALVPLLAARPRVRISRDRGETYPLRGERPLTTNLPGQPAAVYLYDDVGMAHALVVDLDVSRGGHRQVVADSDRLGELIQQCGGRVIVDESPTGGRHVYLPLTEPVAFETAYRLAVDLAALLPSMDVKPNQNPTAGLIRPPGSVHPRGGHQLLIGPLSAAVHAAMGGNSRAVWDQLRKTVPRQLRTVDAAVAMPVDSQPVNGRHGRPRPVNRDYLAIATTGVYDTDRYDTPSDARQAVILAAANAGLSLTDVLSRVAGGVWPGLQAFYARYKPGDRTRAIRHDWHKAAAYLAKHPAQRPDPGTVHKSPTSEPSTHPPELTGRKSPDEYLFIRTWWSALRMSPGRWPGRAGLARRMVLRSVGEAAMKSGSRYVAFGARSLSIAAGVDHTTAAAHLRALREEQDPFIDLIESRRGLQGDLYQLRIPDGLADRADRAAWPAGRMHALRPAFLELGLPASAIYEALETAQGPVSSFELATMAGIGRSTVYEALETLAAWNLARPERRGRWRIVATTCLTRLAEAWGVLDIVRARISRHRAERAAYRRALRIPDNPWAEIALATWTADVDPPPSGAPPDPPPDPLDTALALLQRELGGYVTVT